MPIYQDVVIWSEEGTWLQTMDGEGRRRSSFCGVLSLTSVQLFCQKRHIAFCIHRPEASRRGERGRPVGSSEVSSRQGGPSGLRTISK